MANENRLIDANAVLAKQFTSGLSDASGNYYGHADVIFADDIENAPTVDAVEVVHGRWEQMGETDYKCSVCGFRFTSCDPISMFKHCRCGAKMDGGNNNGESK